jgi:hypothetical protein
VSKFSELWFGASVSFPTVFPGSSESSTSCSGHTSINEALLIEEGHRRRGLRGGEVSPCQCAPVGGRDRVGVACNGGAARTVWPAAEVNGGGGAPVVRGVTVHVFVS